MINPRIILLWAWGSAMSAVTRMIHQLWYTNLIAIDKYQSQLTDQLSQEWIKVQIGHGATTLNTWDVVIASAAALWSTERLQAQEIYNQDHVKATPPMLMHEFLGELSKYMKTIAITWTHGKSTTTALCGKVFAELDPQFGLCVLGAGLSDRQWANYKLNTSHSSDIKRLTDRIFSRKAQWVEDIWKKYTFIIEADEYNKHMLYYDADTTLITTLSHDHVDIYPTQEDYFSAFRQFSLKTKNTIYGLEIDQGFQRLMWILPQTHSYKVRSVPVQSFEFESLIWWHNYANATLVFQLATDQGLEEASIRQSLLSFNSLRRRAETLGKNPTWCQIISDYAHHPNELISTFHAIQTKYPNQPLHVIFQPHQAQRLLEFRDQAIQTLSQFSNPIVYQIYAAREDVPSLLKEYSIWDDTIIDAESLWKYFSKQCWAKYVSTQEEIVQYINSIDEWIIVLFTAGNLDYLVRNSLANI
jgi:UDP-N-acetylmuramate--alanine ligase